MLVLEGVFMLKVDTYTSAKLPNLAEFGHDMLITRVMPIDMTAV